MKRIILSVSALLVLSACATVETNDPNEPKVAVEREYTTGSMIPQKKSARSTNDVKTVNSDDFNTMPRAATPTDPLGKK